MNWIFQGVFFLHKCIQYCFSLEKKLQIPYITYNTMNTRTYSLLLARLYEVEHPLYAYLTPPKTRNFPLSQRTAI